MTVSGVRELRRFCHDPIELNVIHVELIAIVGRQGLVVLRRVDVYPGMVVLQRVGNDGPDLKAPYDQQRVLVGRVLDLCKQGPRPAAGPTVPFGHVDPAPDLP